MEEKIYPLVVDLIDQPTTNTLHVNTVTNGTGDYSNFYYPTTTFNWPNYIYLYQIKCPKARCKTTNWLQVDVVTPCKTCGAKLKAVTNEADYEIPIDA